MAKAGIWRGKKRKNIKQAWEGGREGDTVDTVRAIKVEKGERVNAARYSSQEGTGQEFFRTISHLMRPRG